MFPESWGGLVVPAINWLIFLVAAVLFYAFHYRRVSPSPSIHGFLGLTFPMKHWASRSGIVDIVMYIGGRFFNSLMAIGNAVMMAVVAGALGAMLVVWLGGSPGFSMGVEAAILLSIAIFVFSELAEYIIHYLEHRVPFLWELHKVHHSARFLTPFTAKRLHPVEVQLGQWLSAVLTGLPVGIAVYLYGLSIVETALIGAAGRAIIPLILLDPLKHSHIPMSFGWFDRIFQSPHMHQLHHSAKYEHWDKNFGSKLSIFDWMFGTMYIPDKDEKLTYGIGRGEHIDEEYDSIVGCYPRPVYAMFKVLVGKRSPHEIPPPASLSPDWPGHAPETAVLPDRQPDRQEATQPVSGSAMGERFTA